MREQIVLEPELKEVIKNLHLLIRHAVRQSPEDEVVFLTVSLSDFQLSILIKHRLAERYTDSTRNSGLSYTSVYTEGRFLFQASGI